MRLNKHESGYYAPKKRCRPELGTASMVTNRGSKNGGINTCERQRYRHGTLIAFVLVFYFRSFQPRDPIVITGFAGLNDTQGLGVAVDETKRSVLLPFSWSKTLQARCLFRSPPSLALIQGFWDPLFSSDFVSHHLILIQNILLSQ